MEKVRMKAKAPIYLFCCLVVFSVNTFLMGQVPLRDNFLFEFENNFEDDPLGHYSLSEYREDWNLSPTSTIDPQNMVDIVVDSDSRFNKVVRGFFPQGTLLIAEHGFFWDSPLSNQQNELYFSYDIKFKSGFDWVKGGKLPGLLGGKFVTGKIPTTTDGFSARMMWKEDGKLVFYVYHQDQPIIYGSTYVWENCALTSGKWYNITIRVVLNTITNGVAAKNGILEGFVDGKLMFQKKDVRFRSLESIKIDRMRVAAFFGGNTEDWACTNDEWIDTDNFVAYTYSSKAPNVPRGNQISSSTTTLLHPYYNFSSKSTSIPVPSAPSELNAEIRSSSSINLSWKDNSSDETGFSISRSLSSTEGFSEIKTLVANTSSYQDINLNPGTTYYYKLRAYNQGGYSVYSPVTQKTTSTIEVPEAPTLFSSTTQTNSTIDLSWNDNSTNEQGFEIFRSVSDNEGFVKVASCEADENSCTDKSLQTNVTYYYKLRSFNSYGSSDYTPVLKVATKSGSIVQDPTNNAKTVYIDPETMDIHPDGSFLHPYKSWAEITWKEGFTYLQKKGSTTTVDVLQIGASNITLGAYGEGEIPVISSQSATYLISGFEKSGIEIRDLNLIAANAISCIYFLGSNSDSLVINNCILNGNVNAIKVVDGRNLIAKYNSISSGDEGIFSTADNNVIYYNIFDACHTAVNILGNSSKAKIYNNVFVDNMKSLSDTYAELTLYNNIFYLSEDNQVALNHGTGKITSDNNIFYPEQKGFISIAGKFFDSLNELQQQLKIDLNSLTKDPLFVDIANKKFNLNSNSAAINSGKNLNLEFDLDGTKVPIFSIADIGAFEFNGNINNPSGKQSSNGTVKLYPNPSTGPVTIEGQINESLIQDEPSISVQELKVLDMTGKTIFSKSINMNGTAFFQDKIDLSEYANGVYFVVLQIADKIVNEKLLISK
jgi:hypothetical protein